MFIHRLLLHLLRQKSPNSARLAPTGLTYGISLLLSADRCLWERTHLQFLLSSLLQAASWLWRCVCVSDRLLQSDILTDRQADKHTDRQRDNMHMDRQTDRQTGRKAKVKIREKDREERL